MESADYTVGHTHRSDEGIDEAGAGRCPHVAHRQHEWGWDALQIRVVRKRQVRLRHADRQTPESLQISMRILKYNMALYSYCIRNLLFEE